MTYTFAKLDVSPAAYDEIRGKLVDAGYEHAFGLDDDVELIDMHGIALVRATVQRDASTSPNVFQDDIAAILRAMGLSDHARPYSAHEVVQQEILPVLRARKFICSAEIMVSVGDSSAIHCTRKWNHAGVHSGESGGAFIVWTDV